MLDTIVESLACYEEKAKNLPLVLAFPLKQHVQTAGDLLFAYAEGAERKASAAQIAGFNRSSRVMEWLCAGVDLVGISQKPDIDVARSIIKGLRETVGTEVGLEKNGRPRTSSITHYHA